MKVMQDLVSLVDILQDHAENFPEHTAIKFITQKGWEGLTYVELNRKIKWVAQHLQDQVESNARAVIILPPGLNYVIALLACFYAGIIAVPIYPPRKNQHAHRVFSVIQDSNAALVITNHSLTDNFRDCSVFNMDLLPHTVDTDYQPRKILPDNIAFIQYTSGSTTEPKGVLISHRNLMTNLRIIQNIFPGGEDHKVCSWLPPYHDMGLIGGILCSLFIRTELLLMSPTYFLQSPVRWLEIISKERVTMTVAPNFAFDFCARRVTQEQLQQLDLSCLQCIYNGSEPIHWATLQRFSDTFSATGFSTKALHLCYGLAEATLMLTVKSYDEKNSTLRVVKTDFENGLIKLASEESKEIIEIVNCGRCAPEHTIKIVDPLQLTPLGEGEIGEIWASGPSIAKGYWNQPEATQKIFANHLPGENQPYLRTNDLGFLYQGFLYVTGRMSDLMIIHGKNYYPQDIERYATQVHPAFEMQSNAAFTLESFDEMPKFVLLQEVHREILRSGDSELLISRLKGMLFEHGLVPYAIVLVKSYSLPKTSSGKIKRNAARIAYMENKLDIITAWKQESDERFAQEVNPDTSNYLKSWLNSWLKQHLQMNLTEEDYEKSLVDLGINSIAAVELSNDLQNKLGRPLELLPLFEQYSLNQLVSILWEKIHLPISGKESIHLKRTFESEHQEEQFISNLRNIYLKVNDGISSNVTNIEGHEFINYSGYNYLGLSGDPVVTEAVIEAVKIFGTSVSASRLVSGEKSVHGQLEKSIANLIGTEDCLVLPSGYSTNITIITHLCGKDDLIIYDELCHNSILQGALFSGADRMPFPHNDYQAIAIFLEKFHGQYRKILIITEGIFSMDGDIPDIKQLIALKKKYKAHLMVDEAHSMGVLGTTGCGLREYYDVSPTDVDIWMGTLSKSFASCGGYIAGSKELIDSFKYTAAGFVYSAGISPANAAAALAAIKVMQQEPERLAVLRKRQTLLLAELQRLNLPTGLSRHTPIIPLVVGKDSLAIQLSVYLQEHHILALPIIYPAVQKNLARVRLFVNCLHTEEQIDKTVTCLKNAAFLKPSLLEKNLGNVPEVFLRSTVS
jgi:8-amino-7-oxononanoate synthase